MWRFSKSCGYPQISSSMLCSDFSLIFLDFPWKKPSINIGDVPIFENPLCIYVLGCHSSWFAIELVYGIPVYPPVNVYITMENHHVEWVNQLFLWPFSIANCLFTRGYNNMWILLWGKYLWNILFIGIIICQSYYWTNGYESYYSNGY